MDTVIPPAPTPDFYLRVDRHFFIHVLVYILIPWEQLTFIHKINV